MDSRLKARLIKISAQIEMLYKVESAFLTIDGAKDHQLAVLMASAPPSASSEAARASWAKATPEWITFRKTLAQSEAAFHREKHRLELCLKAYDAEHLSFKIEESSIRRGAE